MSLSSKEIFKKYENSFFNPNAKYFATSLMNDNEQIFFKQLLNIFKNKYYIFPQVCLMAYINTLSIETKQELYRFPDFLICDKKFQPIIVLELNGESHKQQYTKLRDKSVKSILQSCKIPLLQFKNNKQYEDKKLKEIIESEIHLYKNLRNE